VALECFYSIFSQKIDLIRIAPLAFVPHRRSCSSQTPSPQVVLWRL